jgi:hypothetical protein
MGSEQGKQQSDLDQIREDIMSGFTRNRSAQSEIIKIQMIVCAAFYDILGEQPMLMLDHDSDNLSFRAEYNNSKMSVDIIGRYGVNQWFVDILSYDLAKDALSKHVSTSDVSHAGIREAVKKATQNLR